MGRDNLRLLRGRCELRFVLASAAETRRNRQRGRLLAVRADFVGRLFHAEQYRTFCHFAQCRYYVRPIMTGHFALTSFLPERFACRLKTFLSKPLDKTADFTLDFQGAIYVQYRRCGKKNCHCATGEKHGPYYFRFWRTGGKLLTKYIKRADVEQTRAACERNRQSKRYWRTLRDESTGLFREMRGLLKEWGDD